MVIMPVVQISGFSIVESFINESDRGVNGFGGTGVNT